MRTLPLALAAVLACALVATRARADDEPTKEACASASEDAQRLQHQGRLLASRQRLLVCTRPSCPAVVRQDCDGWLVALDAQLPSVVIAARDTDGRDLAARVQIDGAPVDASSGRAVPLDPGKHALRVESDGKIPVNQDVIVGEGERARPIVVTLQAKDRPPPAAAPAAPYVRTPLVYVFATLAGAALVGFGVLQVMAVSDSSHLHATCAPRCAQSDVDAVSTENALAHVSLVAAGVFGAATAVTWFVDSPPRASSAVTAGLGGVRVRF